MPFTITGIIMQRGWPWLYKHDPFATAGRDVISITSVVPPRSAFYFADAKALYHITTSRATKFPKPIVEFYKPAAAFGPNLIVAEGAEWKRMRRPINPAFGDRTMRFVWETAMGVASGLFDTPEWKGKGEVRIGHVVDITLPMALLVLGIAAFGKQMRWEDDDFVPEGHTLTFESALHTVSTTLLEKFVLPNWAYPLRADWRNIDLAGKELLAYVKEMIHERRSATEKVHGNDLFTGLLAATEIEEDPLRDDELIGNLFILLFAGHETTAHTLAFTFALLALHQDEQEKLFQHIDSNLRALDRAPEWTDMGKFSRCLAVLHETLRMFPAAPELPKSAAEECHVPMDDGSTVFVPAGSIVDVSVIGLHYNPRYWENPHMFKPDRFLAEDWPKDAFIPFSAGMRACIGRRFFETEAIAFLISVVSRYSIKPQDPDVSAEELLKATFSLTLAPVKVPLVFKLRK
ncbi:cytochrome P450 [Exidia glandulosa HHB12029]|uniref:Cytochrome P450 n=1 Tax=Exidia glandulosa HHB12029 TaxID=1314781 RepID=A0A165ZN30_EXIGL|nr:cytochrome P450 [Exidia glandulosa HHB12029]